MDIYDIELANRQAGYHFFDPASKRFFDSRIGQDVYEGPGGIFFTTSERFHPSSGPSAKRRYTVRRFDPATKRVTDASQFQEFGYASGARRRALDLAAGRVTAAA